ncbi:MAG: L,D-transpeptidase family protein [Phycisphaeraceae bacterium]
MALAVLGVIFGAVYLSNTERPAGALAGPGGERTEEVSTSISARAGGPERADATGGNDTPSPDASHRVETSSPSPEPSPAMVRPRPRSVAELPPPQSIPADTNTDIAADDAPGDTAGASAPSPREQASSAPAPPSRRPSGALARTYDEALATADDGDPVAARTMLSRLLFDHAHELSPGEARAVREQLARLNDRLIFSSNIRRDDPVAASHEVVRGELLGSIARHYGLTYRILERINGLDARSLQVGQSIKVLKGPFHARIIKSQFLMDVYLESPDGEPLFVRSFSVGLGEEDSTPTGRWVVTPGRKVVDPDWRNPRTGEYFSSDDPNNPIGSHWIALTGIDEENREMRGYGIHGTIDAESIGEQRSMGCIRLADGDIELVFDMLVAGQSTVEVLP